MDNNQVENPQVIDIDKKSINKIISSLEEMVIICGDKALKEKINDIINFVETEISKKIEQTLPETIYSKMLEVKNTNPELSTKLYILYRNLCNKEIDEDVAKETYETYIMMESFDKIVW